LQLIHLAHSPHTNIKSIVSEGIPKYIKYFPDLEDDAINAVYDLCEDPEQQVRIYNIAPLWRLGFMFERRYG
jgi:hypothetical protein